MQIRILGWSYRGIRGVNNLDISMTKDEQTPYQVSLLMMPNGTGKTTTITLLRAIFDGQAMSWSAEFIRSFRPSVNLAEGFFSVNLLIDQRKYKITLRLNYIRGMAFYSVIRVEGDREIHLGSDLPNYVKDVLSEGFVKRFVFDGELANSILSSKEKEAEEAVRFLYHINRLTEVKSSVERIILEEQRRNEKGKNRTKTKTEQGLNSLRTQLLNKKAQYDLLNSRVKQLKVESEELNEKIKLINASLKSNRNKESALERMLVEHEKLQVQNAVALKEKTTKLLEDFRNPNLISQRIADRFLSLSNDLNCFDLSRSLPKRFLENLADQELCVCGRPLGHDDKELIKKNAKESLAEDQLSLIHSLKASMQRREFDLTISEDSAEVEELLRSKKDLYTEWERLTQRRRAESNEEDQALLDELQVLSRRYNELVQEIDLITTKDKNKQAMVASGNNIVLVEADLNDLERRYNEATLTVQFSSNGQKVNDYISYIEMEAIKNLKEMIRLETNDKLSQIIKSEQIYVEKIDGHLMLRGKTGTSVGQALAIAYSYLGSLFQTSSHELPFVVDSPAGALDLGVRREVSKILPDLFQQLIIFITSGEREGFAEHFYTLENTQFITIHRDNSHVSFTEGKESFQKFQEISLSERNEMP